MTEYLIVPMGVHLLELIRQNPVNVVAAIDCRDNGSLIDAGIHQFTQTVHVVGSEGKLPLISIFNNFKYYQNISRLLNLYRHCNVIITSNYTPLSRFIIDKVGYNRIELWEDGLNHYLKLEKMYRMSHYKNLIKLLCGYYPKNIFDSNYKEHKLVVKDRFDAKNLNYERINVSNGRQYYIGQPLIEDNLIREATLSMKLRQRFKDANIIYLPHPREKQRSWLNDIFDVHHVKQTAEQYIIANGADAIYSAFSTANVNLQCQKNVFLCKYLGLEKIHKRLSSFDFDVQLH